MYWLPETHAKYGAPLVEALVQGVSWKMDFLVPNAGVPAMGTKLSQNRRIALYPYNRSNVSGVFPVRRLLYRLGLGMPRPQNVLVAAIFLLLKSGARRIYLCGAEHNWHQTIHLTGDNVLFADIPNPESPDAGGSPFYKVDGGEVFSVPEIFAAWAAVHRSYHDLSGWAEALGARVENITPVTFVDAFPRSSAGRLIDDLKGNSRTRSTSGA
jgi:hypothetical protein